MHRGARHRRGSQDRGMNANLDKAIGTRLKELRVKAGFSLNELAARSGVSRAMIGRVERAQSSATAALLNKLCAALDVTLSDVVALSEKPPERLTRLADQPHWPDPDSPSPPRPPPPPPPPNP